MPATPHKPGLLIAVEGTDGSGKTTQAHHLCDWLRERGASVVFTEWCSSKLVSKTIKKGKRLGLLRPYTFSTMHATDFAHRLESEIRPALAKGSIVIADRYLYTALARDAARGLPADWVRSLYSFAHPPHLTFYFRVSGEIALSRILTSRQPKYYEAGMDLGLHEDLYESFRRFHARVTDAYDRMARSDRLVAIRADLPVGEQRVLVRRAVERLLKENGFAPGTAKGGPR
ncbi:MAG: dTMP kinase [Planctomycetes bacterium]|nr:dTMP kinase [Planctomycetota bacterium]